MFQDIRWRVILPLGIELGFGLSAIIFIFELY